MQTPQHKINYPKYLNTPSTAFRSNQQSTYKHLIGKPGQYYHRNSLQNDIASKVNHTIAFQPSADPFKQERMGTFIQKEPKGSSMHINLTTESSVDEHSLQPRDFRDQYNQSHVKVIRPVSSLQSYQPSKVYSTPVYYPQNPVNNYSAINPVAYPWNQRISLHSSPDLQIIIKNNTHQDQIVQLNVDTYDPETRKGSLQKRKRVVPAHSKYFYEALINDQALDRTINQNNYKNQKPLKLSQTSTTAHSVQNNIRQPEVSQFWTNPASIVQKSRHNDRPYQFQFKTLAERGFQKIEQCHTRIIDAKPKQNNQIYIEDEQSSNEQRKRETAKKMPYTKFQDQVYEQQQNYSFKKESSSKKSSTARFQTENEDAIIPIYQKYSKLLGNQSKNERYNKTQAYDTYKNRHLNHKKTEQNLQKSFKKKDAKFIIAKNKVLDQLKNQQNYNPLKSRLSQTGRSFDRMLSKNKKLSPRCQMITDRLFNDARSKSKPRSPCLKYQKHKQSMARINFRQKIKEFGFVQRYLTCNELDDMYLKLAKSDIPEQQWAMKVVDHVYEKMSHAGKY